MLAFEQAIELFDQEYFRSNGFGKAGIPLDQWSPEEVKRFLVHCDQAATSRGAQLKGAIVGVNVANKLGIRATVGAGEFFEEIPCFVSIDDDDRLDLIFGPSRR